jgi:hypothetical protein
MRTLNRIDGIFKALRGVSVMGGVACVGTLVSPWLAATLVPAWLVGGMWVGAGLAQAATGWSDE